VARNPGKAARLLELANTLGMGARYCALDDDALPGCIAGAAVVVSTLPADIAARYADTIAPSPLLLDTIYDPWPTPLASAVTGAGGRVVGGLQMLLFQALPQVEQFTGRPAPREQMAAALG
ncbi:MAG TPA: shikimate dehydrogenase, partial [Mycobacterium sp.]